MNHTSEVYDVAALAEELGIHIDAEEVEVYRRYLTAQLESLDEFVQSRVAEARPPMVSPARGPGYRPSRAEDPLNAWVWKCEVQGPEGGLLAGKRVSFKDHIAVAGMPISFGSFALDGLVADFDATVVTRVLEAGGTVVGKNSMDGLGGGFGFGGGIGDYGRPRNPHNPDHVTGGSSAGSGAAVAAKEADVAFGGDQGGSIRIPAALCGTVGLKPTFGLVSHFGVGFGSDQSIDFVGPMAGTVEDAAAALEATAGFDGYDPRQGREVPAGLKVVDTLDRGVKGLRIGVLEEGFEDADPGVSDAVMGAVDVLASAGAEITKVSVPEHHTVRSAQMALMPEGSKAVFDTAYYGMFAKTFYSPAVIAAMVRLRTNQVDHMSPRTKMNFMVGAMARRQYSGKVYAKAQNSRPYFVAAFDAALAQLDMLVMPTCLMTAPRYEAPASYLAALEENLSPSIFRVARNTMPYNFTGHPALAVPVDKVGGLPVSMQLVGRFFEDPLLLQAAYAFEHSVDWDAITGVA